MQTHRHFFRFCLFCLVLGFSSLFAFAQQPDWKWQNPLPTGNNLNDVYFVGTQTGWVVGDFGNILKTSNGGSDWSIQSSGFTNKLNSVYFVDTQTGWAVGANGIILKSSNGGQSWQAQNSGTANSLLSVNFTDAQTGWAVGTGGTILKTSNGGSSWQSQSSGTFNQFNSVYFPDAQTGYAVGFPGTILKTNNGGQSWQAQSCEPTNWLTSVHFTDAQTGWAVGRNGTILKASNGGSSWQNQSSGTTNHLYSVHFTDSQTGWAIGNVGTILQTSNGGQSWQAQSSGTTNSLHSAHFTDAQTGWVVGEAGILLKTSNSGQSWQAQNNGATDRLCSVQFTDAQTGWVVGWHGTILKTSNGGQSWQAQSSGTTNLFYSVRFTDTQTGCAVGTNGIILRTSNGGLSWQAQNSGTTKWLLSIHFSDTQTGWVVGLDGMILKTSNGGQSWQAQIGPTTNHLNSVNFIDGQTGWAVGEKGTILKTSNGGQNWQAQSSGTTNPLYSVHFTDIQTGWVVGLDGMILKTTNGGQTWQVKSSGAKNDLYFVHFTNAQTGWAVGENGTILHYQGGLEPEVPSSLITGKLFEKTEANCNNTSVGIPYGVVKAMPGPYYGVAKLDGNYQLRVPLADTPTSFTLSPLGIYSNAVQSTTVCPPYGQIAVTVDTLSDTLSGKNFGFEIIPCHHLDVQLGSNRRRRCFVNTTSISYINKGSLSAHNAYVLVEFPHWVRPLSASRPHVALNDSIWRFDLGIVAPGSGGSFTIQDSVLCGNVTILGLPQCTKATIFPAPDCPPPGNWSGAEISVSGKCENGLVKLGIYNKTSVSMPDSVDYWVYLDSVQVRAGKVKLAAGDSLKLQVVPGGMGVYLSVNQVAGHPGQVFVSTAVEGCGFFPLASAVSTHLPVSQRPNSKTQCLPIVGAYDPNDKQGFPMGFTNQNVIAPNTRLEYLVRFQNTGNDTAFTVFVIDTLDQNLNVESFEMGAASHPFELSMQTTKSGKTSLRWQFNNILLADSNTNEPASNGFIQFRISPKPGLALGSKVRNHAEIYFDFNPPIVTNQTLSTYDVLTFTDPSLNNNVVIDTLDEKQLEQELGVRLYPNPARNTLTAEFSTSGTLTIYNTQGQLALLRELPEGKHQLPLDFAPGLYWVKVQTKDGVRTQKLVKQ